MNERHPVGSIWFDGFIENADRVARYDHARLSAALANARRPQSAELRLRKFRPRLSASLWQCEPANVTWEP